MSHFVDLAPLAEPELVIGAVARALGVTESGTQPVFDALVEVVRDREALLVTDNFEHLLTAAAMLAELLAAAPGVQGAGDEPRSAPPGGGTRVPDRSRSSFLPRLELQTSTRWLRTSRSRC